MTLNRRNAMRSIFGLLVWACAGCTPPPATNQTDILDTVRNGAVGAEVRRLDDGAQAYVGEVFRTYNAWKASVGDLEGLTNVDTFWVKTDPSWRDADKIKHQLNVIEKWVGDADEEKAKAEAATVADAASKDPATLEREFRSAAENTAPLTGIDTSGLPQAVLKTLDFEAARQRYRKLAADYRALLILVEEHRAAFDPAVPGLAFTSSEAARTADEHWQRMHDRFTQDRADERAGIDRLLTEGRKEREMLVEQKKAMSKAGSTAEVDVRKFRELDLKIKYFDARIKAAEARKKRLG